MKKNPLNKGIIMENAAGIGAVTPAMVEARARELAAINGHPSQPSEADYQQAKRELTGEAETDPQEESSESVPDSAGWDPVPGSTGRQAADSLGEDEDAGGTRGATNQSHSARACHVPSLSLRLQAEGGCSSDRRSCHVDKVACKRNGWLGGCY